MPVARNKTALACCRIKEGRVSSAHSTLSRRHKVLKDRSFLSRKTGTLPESACPGGSARLSMFLYAAALGLLAKKVDTVLPKNAEKPLSLHYRCEQLRL